MLKFKVIIKKDQKVLLETTVTAPSILVVIHSLSNTISLLDEPDSLLVTPLN